MENRPGRDQLNIKNVSNHLIEEFDALRKGKNPGDLNRPRWALFEQIFTEWKKSRAQQESSHLEEEIIVERQATTPKVFEAMKLIGGVKGPSRNFRFPRRLIMELRKAGMEFFGKESDAQVISYFAAYGFIQWQEIQAQQLLGARTEVLSDVGEHEIVVENLSGLPGQKARREKVVHE
jgi:hypothetical protein